MHELFNLLSRMADALESIARHESTKAKTRVRVNRHLAKKREEQKPKRAKVFRPPEVSDVADYCLDRKNGIDPRAFVDFYQSKGWMIGKNKMKDWRAAVRTWEKNGMQHANGPKGGALAELKRQVEAEQ
jgi:hypothetical protein